jgi:hypothetical protein
MSILEDYGDEEVLELLEDERPRASDFEVRRWAEGIHPDAFDEWDEPDYVPHYIRIAYSRQHPHRPAQFVTQREIGR